MLTGTQVLLLIVSQTGLVFTFSTPKLRPVVMETDGRELIQRCLSAPDEDVEGDEGEETAMGGEDDEGGDDDDDEERSDVEDDEEESRSMISRSPSKGPITVMRPGPGGATPKRSGSNGHADGGAAGRRSRAATMSNATVRQHMNSVGSPEQAVPGINVPVTPATPNSARNRKRRRTAAESSQSTTTGSAPPPSAVNMTNSASHSVHPSPSQPPPIHLHNMNPPNSAPSHLENMPGPSSSSAFSAPPPHIQQSHYYRPMANNSSFLMGPGGGIDPASTQGGPSGSMAPATINTEFFFNPVDTNKQQHQQHQQLQHQQHQQHHQQLQQHQHQQQQGGMHLMQHNQHQQMAQQHQYGGSMGSTPSLTSSPHTNSGGASSAGFSPHNGQYPSFGQSYGMFGQQQQQQHQQQQHQQGNRPGAPPHSASSATSTLYSPNPNNNVTLTQSPWSEPIGLPSTGFTPGGLGGPSHGGPGGDFHSPSGQGASAFWAS